ncbi:MAG: hypothetical protein E7159_02505 [Firmicutes bacterium]|nr:hypothetical protein [Bacillota bacterium]
MDKKYISLFHEIKTTYQWWGIDLTSMLDNIKKTDKLAYDAFHTLYEEKDEEYYLKELKTRKLFLDQLSRLIPKQDESYVRINAIPLIKDYECVRMQDEFRQSTYDYALAIILLSQDFLYKNLNKNREVTINKYSKKNYVTGEISKLYMLAGYNNRLSCNISSNQNGDMESTIIIPGQAIIEYNAYKENPKIRVRI